MLELSGKSVLVLGLGVSGRSAANFCAARGARVVAADERAEGVIEGLQTLDAGIERDEVSGAAELTIDLTAGTLSAAP